MIVAYLPEFQYNTFYQKVIDKNKLLENCCVITQIIIIYY